MEKGKERKIGGQEVNIAFSIDPRASRREYAGKPKRKKEKSPRWPISGSCPGTSRLYRGHTINSTLIRRFTIDASGQRYRWRSILPPRPAFVGRTGARVNATYGRGITGNSVCPVFVRALISQTRNPRLYDQHRWKTCFNDHSRVCRLLINVRLQFGGGNGSCQSLYVTDDSAVSIFVLETGIHCQEREE